MANPAPLRFHNITTSRVVGEETTARLILFPATGAKMREVPLSRADLVKLIENAATALRRLED